MSAPVKKEGFTIIEVVLVLAIAGLIFLMVFIALPALQRNQRDTSRKNDMGRIQTAITSASSNNRGTLPTFNAAFIDKYLTVGGDEFADPSGKPYAFAATDDLTSAALPNKADATTDEDNVRIFVTDDARCASDGALEGNQGARKVALRMTLEGGGISCVNN